MYDWANSAFVTTIITAVFPIYYSAVAAAEFSPSGATSRFTITTVVALAIAAVMAPLIGAIADHAPIKKRLLSVFIAVGALATAGLFFVERGDWMLASVLFAVGTIAATASFVIYDSLLPHIARPTELDRVSTAGYALGYVGGGVLLLLNIVMIKKPALFGFADAGVATRVAFISVAVWWIVFSIPLFRRVAEPPIAETAASGDLFKSSFRGMMATFRELRRYKQAVILLFAFLIYNDGIGTIIKLATVYGTEIGLDAGAMITAILLVQFIGIPFTFVFGQLATKLGAKRSIYLALVVYMGVSVLGYFMTSALHFYLLAAMVGMVQGGAQALSRSLFASMIPKEKSSEFFGLFSVFEKFAGIFGPAIFAGAIWITGSSRPAILSVIGFFAVGMVLLARVDVEAGQRAVAEPASEAA